MTPEAFCRRYARKWEKAGLLRFYVDRKWIAYWVSPMYAQAGYTRAYGGTIWEPDHYFFNGKEISYKEYVDVCARINATQVWWDGVENKWCSKGDQEIVSLILKRIEELPEQKPKEKK